ncbi:MAG: hypothetical protein U0168_21910 [Nannocystaceae bacterium]
MVAVLGCSLGCDVAGVSDVAEPVVADAPRSGQGFAGGGPQRGGAPMGQRWVLRDAMGTAIDAVVEPTCGGGVECVVSEPGSAGGLSPPCVRVTWLSGEYVDLKYSTASGLLAECITHKASLSELGSYIDESCAGSVYWTPGAGIEQTSRWTRKAYYIDSEGHSYVEVPGSVEVDTMYDFVDGICTAFSGQTVAATPWHPVADELEALPLEPPYLLSWE